MKKSFVIILIIVVLLAVSIPVINAAQRNSKYTDAKARLEAAQDPETIYNTIQSIIVDFSDLGDYKDSKALLQEARSKQVTIYIGQRKFDQASSYIRSYNLTATHPHVAQLLAEARAQEADRLLAEENYEEAINLLQSYVAESPEALQKLTDARYAYATHLEKEGLYEEAYNAYLQSGHTLGLKSAYSIKYAHMLTKDKISVGSYSKVFAVAKDGTVLYAGAGQNPVADWTDIVAIDGSHSLLVGLKSDGTVVMHNENRYVQYDVSEWRDIVAISAGTHILGLKSDGTVVATGVADAPYCAVDHLSDVIAIYAGSNTTYVILSDGTPCKIGRELNGFQYEIVDTRMTNWPKLQSIVEGNGGELVGITLDGNAVLGNEAYSDYYYGDRHEKGVYYTYSGMDFQESDINHKHWSDIVCVETDDYHCIAVRKDGTVFMGCQSSFTSPSKEVATWTNVAAVASYDNRYVVGLLKDGTLVGSGLDSKVTQAISEWSEITGGGRGLQ